MVGIDQILSVLNGIKSAISQMSTNAHTVDGFPVSQSGAASSIVATDANAALNLVKNSLYTSSYANAGFKIASDATGIYDVALGFGVDATTHVSYIQSLNYASYSNRPLVLQPAGGSVLVNTTTDDGVNKLQVSGTASVVNNLTVKFGSQAYTNIFAQSSSAATVLAQGMQYSASTNGYASSIAGAWAKSAITLDYGNIKFFSDTATTVAIGTDVTPTERMRLDASGNLLVGATSGTSHKIYKNVNNSATLEVNNQSITGAQAIVTNVGMTSGGYAMINYSAGVGKSYIASDGSFGSAPNVYGAYSDIKLKQDITDAGSQWSDIKALRLRKYHFKNDPNGYLQLGLIAQEAELISPGLVDETPDYEEVDGERVATGETTKSVKYSILYLKAVGALQEAMSRIETLEAEILKK